MNIAIRFAALATVALTGCGASITSTTPEQIVRGFYAVVRSGRAPERAAEFLAPHVAAHQMNAEDEREVVRTPAEYATHVHEMQSAYGPFTLEVTELIAQGERVYVRWRQRGAHVGEIEQYSPTGKPLTEIGSAVYRVAGDRIVEYWIQLDREGVRRQLEQHTKGR